MEETIHAIWNWKCGVSITEILTCMLVLWVWKQKLPRRTTLSDPPRLPDSSLISPSSDISDAHSIHAVTVLRKDIPESTEAECIRFLTAKGGDIKLAGKCLREYLTWRHILSVSLPNSSIQSATSLENDDQSDWKIASLIATLAIGKKAVELKRIAQTFSIDGKEISCSKGHRILKITPGLMDERIATLPTYALAIACYIDRKLKRESAERVTVVIDVRGGRGWRNLNAAQLLPFIRDTCTLLLAMFPERLARSIVYPVPPAFNWIWSLARRCIDPVTAEKICLLAGPATIMSAPPVAALATCMSEEAILLIESERIAMFSSC